MKFRPAASKVQAASGYVLERCGVTYDKIDAFVKARGESGTRSNGKSASRRTHSTYWIRRQASRSAGTTN